MTTVEPLKWEGIRSLQPEYQLFFRALVLTPLKRRSLTCKKNSVLSVNCQVLNCKISLIISSVQVLSKLEVFIKSKDLASGGVKQPELEF